MPISIKDLFLIVNIKRRYQVLPIMHFAPNGIFVQVVMWGDGDETYPNEQNSLNLAF